MSRLDAVAHEAKRGERLIEVKVYFFTEGIANGKGKIRPRHAWGSGWVTVVGNKAHGIGPKRPLSFGSLLDLPAAIEKVLIQNGITIHTNGKMSRYLVSNGD